MGEVTEGNAWAVVVLDRLDSALGSLDRFLSKRRRRRLAKAVFRDVLQAIRESRVVDQVVLATSDPDAVALSRAEGIRAQLAEESGSSAQEAAKTSLDAGAEILALLHADLPLLEAQDLGFLWGRMALDADLVLVPTPGSFRLGAVLARSEEGLKEDFEAGDLDSWREAGQRLRLAVEVYGITAGMRPSGPRDLLQVYKAARPTRAKALLRDWDLGPRLRAFAGEGP